MVDLIKPSELPPATQAYSDSELIIEDAGAVKKATAKMVADAGAPVATEAQAIAGSNNERRMTPLRVKQVLDNAVAPSVLRAQAWAESSTNPDPADPDSKSAKTWASLAEADASAAASSESAAAISASNASSSANSANNSANAASSSALAASNSASSASNSASSALLSASNASNSAQDASDSALAASGSAFNAANSASNALSSANSATMSKDEAHDWAVAAQTAAGAVGGAPQSWGDFQAGVFTAFADGALASFNGVNFERDRSSNIPNLPTGPGWKIFGDITPLHFGADNTGVEDCTSALGNWWSYLKTLVVTPYSSTLGFIKEKALIPSGQYAADGSVNFTSLRVWNTHIIADGAVIVGRVDGKSIVDMCDTRGIHVHGLSIYSTSEFSPNSGIIIGPKGTDTCGNNKFTDVKILGKFSIAALHNIGSETTRHDMSYYMNVTGFSLALDGLNMLGAVSDYVSLRAPGTAVSFTNNYHASCRFENADTSGDYPDSVYVEGTGGLDFDPGCYFLALHGAPVRMRDRGTGFRNTGTRISGLFETHFSSGIDYCIRVVVDDAKDTALSGFIANFQRSHAKTAIIRVETPDGLDMTSGSVVFRNAVIRHDTISYGASKLFSGARIAFTGEIAMREGAAINVMDLLYGYGTIYVDNITTIPTTPANSQIGFDVYGLMSLSGTGKQSLLGNGVGIGMQGGTTPAVRAVGPANDIDLSLVGKGSGLVRFGTRTAQSDSPITGYITIKDAAGATRKIAIID